MNAKSGSGFVMFRCSLSLLVITLFSAPAHAPAQTVWGSALSFDGVNDFVVVTNFGLAVPSAAEEC